MPLDALRNRVGFRRRPGKDLGHHLNYSSDRNSAISLLLTSKECNPSKKPWVRALLSRQARNQAEDQSRFKVFVFGDLAVASVVLKP